MNASVYFALEKLCKSNKYGYSSADISALIFDKFGGLKLVDNRIDEKEVYSEFYMIAAHFLSECVAADRHTEVETVTLSEVAELFRKGRSKLYEVKNNLAIDHGVKNCSTEFGNIKFKLVSESANGVKISESEFNKTHKAPDFTHRDYLVSKSLEMVFGQNTSAKPKK